MTDIQENPLRTGGEPYGARRSTFQPALNHETHNDVEIAAALAEALSLYTGPILLPELAPLAPAASVVSPAPPVRRSLTDDELIRVIEAPQSTLEAITTFEAELTLRVAEARQFQDWESTMLSLGSPVALESLNEVRETFTGVIPIITAIKPAQSTEPPSSAPEPQQSDPAIAHETTQEPARPAKRTRWWARLFRRAPWLRRRS